MEIFIKNTGNKTEMKDDQENLNYTKILSATHETGKNSEARKYTLGKTVGKCTLITLLI